jgi:hypothetical protein
MCVPQRCCAPIAHVGSGGLAWLTRYVCFLYILNINTLGSPKYMWHRPTEFSQFYGSFYLP